MRLSQILTTLCFLPFSLCAQHQITGEILSPNALSVCNVLVELRNADGQLLAQDLSEEDGTFVLSDIPTGIDYVLEFSKEGSPLNGTSTFDLVLLARRILGIDPIQPYDVWIGDVNGSGSFTTLDMVIIRKVILQIDPAFPVPAWAFDAPFVAIPDNQIPIPELAMDISVDVIGVKRADFNASAAPNCQ